MINPSQKLSPTVRFGISLFVGILLLGVVMGWGKGNGEIKEAASALSYLAIFILFLMGLRKLNKKYGAVFFKWILVIGVGFFVYGINTMSGDDVVGLWLLSPFLIVAAMVLWYFIRTPIADNKESFKIKK